MADNTDLLNQFRQIVREETSRLETAQEEMRAIQQEQGRDIKTIKDDHGRKLDEHTKRFDAQDKKLDQIMDDAAHTRTVLESLEGTIKETKMEVDEIKKRQRPQKVD